MRKRTNSNGGSAGNGGSGLRTIGGIKFATRRERVQLVALVLVALGFFSLLFRFSELPGVVSAARNRDALAHSTTAMRGAAGAGATATSAGVHVEKKGVAEKAPSVTITKASGAAAYKPAAMAPLKSLDELNELGVCERERGLALIDVVRASGKTFCANTNDDATTQVTLFNVNGGIKSTVFTNLVVNMAGVKIHRPIKDLSQDGGSHDPRFIFNSNLLHCSCSELAQFSPNAPLNIWETALALVDTKKDPASTLCDPSLSPSMKVSASNDEGVAQDAEEEIVEFNEPVILISRRDDHNPFFQISNALNGWIVAKALGWDLQKTRVVHFDAGYPSPVDALHQKLLSPNLEIVKGETLMGKRVHFKSHVMLSPWEVSGPMMQHLNDDEPCHTSQLFKEFRHLALTTMGVPTEKQHAVDIVNNDKDLERNDADDQEQEQVTLSSSVVVTVITRRPYKGRKVQRVWQNEDEILSKMRDEYKDLSVVFQSIEFVDLTLQKQMEVIVNSDVVIGMHGAGMVNIFWARAETLIVEIFPRERRRWGYRNLCQFLDCDWHEFRGGEDIGKDKDPNSKDKKIAYDEWKAFFDGIFRTKYAQVVEDAQLNDLEE